MNGYSSEYRRARSALLESNPLCVYCRVKVANTADHVPPLSSFAHPELWSGKLVPACLSCNSRLGAKISNDRRRKIKGSRKW